MNQGKYTIKTTDLSTYMVTSVISLHRSRAYETLAALGYPDKVIVRAFERDTRSGYLDWGVSVTRPFLTREGEAYLRAAPRVD